VPGVAYWLREDGAKGSHKISAQKFKVRDRSIEPGPSIRAAALRRLRARSSAPTFHVWQFIGALLSVGASVLVSDIDVIYARNPFHHLCKHATRSTYLCRAARAHPT
jgi:hypothetical protein